MKFELIEDCRNWWKMWSVRLAVLPALVAAFLTTNPNVLSELVAYVPENMRPLASVLVAIIVWGVPTVVRLIPQRKLSVVAVPSANP